MRASGILTHISSLPSDFGIGTFGQAAFDFVDFLMRAGQKYWQILPIGPTGYGDSPYQSFSTFAGNPYFIDLDLLEQDGLLDKADYDAIDWGGDPTLVDYSKLYDNRFFVLRKAFWRGFGRDAEQVADFRSRNAGWVEDYALFMALKDFFGGAPWDKWNFDIKLRQEHAMGHYKRHLEQEINYWIYIQYLYYGQWNTLKACANEHGIRLIGDIPIYVAGDSADVWAHPELFQLDDQLQPTFVAGVPPDYFALGGQLWGNPLYRWERHAETGYAWWIERVRAATTVYDMVRIDHFRGFASYYAIPYGDTDARDGHWEPGPRIEVFDAVRRALGECSIIAEDLGALTDDVYELLERSGFPGMKVLQFAFDSNWNNVYLPHNHIKKCVVYTGTHDNDTLASWWETALDDDGRKHATDYMRLSDEEGVYWGILRTAWSSVADLVVAPIQDFLAYRNSARMNRPSTLGGNWQFRLEKGVLTDALADKIKTLTGLYQRLSL